MCLFRSLHHLHATLPILGSAYQDVLEEDGNLKLTDLDLEAKVLRELEGRKPGNDGQMLKKQVGQSDSSFLFLIKYS